MSGSHEKAGVNWTVNKRGDGKGYDAEQAQFAVLMDIRHELKMLNEKLSTNQAYTRSVRDEVRQVNKRMLKAGYKARG